MRLFRFIVNSIEFCLAYGNPLEIFYHRMFFPKGDVRVVDRASKTHVRCKVAAYQMFGEVWRDHDYDVPRIPIRTGDVVVDIGGNHGFYTCYAAHFGARVLAFEPAPVLFQYLEKNVKDNGFAERVTARCCAVSDRRGRVEMMLTESMGGGMNTIVREFAEKSKMEVSGRIEVELTTFDDILAENHIDRVRICKLDCEGAEWMILKAMNAQTAAKVDAFVIEYHSSGYDVKDLVRHLLSWDTHQVSYAEDKYCERIILRAVRNDLLTQ